jgi:hypothetical protein
MDVSEEIDKFKNLLVSEALFIKNNITAFYDENKDSADKLQLYLDYHNKFDDVVNNFSDTYSLSFPESFKESIYYIYPLFTSLDVSVELKSYYKELAKKIFDTLPPLDDSLEVE